MGRSPWSTQEETEWLLERLPAFRAARANETCAQWLNGTYQSYFNKFWQGIQSSAGQGGREEGEEAKGPGGVTFQKRKIVSRHSMRLFSISPTLLANILVVLESAVW